MIAIAIAIRPLARGKRHGGKGRFFTCSRARWCVFLGGKCACLGPAFCGVVASPATLFVFLHGRAARREGTCLLVLRGWMPVGGCLGMMVCAAVAVLSAVLA